jgi:phosphoglycolate phosphatase
MYKTIIFDFDGTIADTFAVFYTILRELGPEIGIGEISPEDILEYRKKGVKELIKQFKIKFWRIPFLIKKGQKMFGDHIENTNPFEKIPETLRQLFEARIKLGIITTNSKSNVKRFLKKHDLEVFDFIISTPSLFGKTAPLKKVINIADEIRDIENAKSVGISIGAVTWGYNDANLLKSKNPDFVFESPGEIASLIREAR